MAKRITHELSYDASVADVRAMLFDPAFREAVATEQHATRATVEIEGERVRFETVQAARKIPSFAKKFVGEEIVIDQHEAWSGDSAKVTVEIPGKPGEVKGSSALREEGGSTVQRVELEVKVSVPLVGGKIEGLIADLLVKALEAEERAGRAWLQR